MADLQRSVMNAFKQAQSIRHEDSVTSLYLHRCCVDIDRSGSQIVAGNLFGNWIRFSLYALGEEGAHHALECNSSKRFGHLLPSKGEAASLH